MQLDYMKHIFNNQLPMHWWWSISPRDYVGSDYYCEAALDHPLLFSTLLAHCGMEKIVADLNMHAVIPQTSHGSARSFLSQLLTTWSSASVGINL